MHPGLSAADAAGAAAYVEASPMGLGLYLKHGWARTGELSVDLGKYGGEGVVVDVCLRREGMSGR